MYTVGRLQTIIDFLALLQYNGDEMLDATSGDGLTGPRFTCGSEANRLRSLRIDPTIDGALYPAAEIIWPEISAVHNRDLWGAGPDGTYAWRNQADGVFE